jgi:F-type H+-transporting ATPase subunit b
MLTINGTLIAIVINFIILVYVLNYFMYEPIRKVLSDRKADVNRMLSEADAKMKTAQTFIENGREAINEANTSAKKLIDQASAAAEKMRTEMLVDAKREVDEHKDRAKEEIRQMKLDAKRSISDEAARLSVVIAEKIIMKKIDRKTQKKMADNFIGKVRF